MSSETEEQPSDVQLYESGNVYSMEWSKNGLWHRENGKPAVVHFWENENLKEEEFFENGEYFREGGLPTRVTYYETGAVEQEIWEDIPGLYDRGDDLPAIITYDPDGNVARKDWYKEGIHYREGDKPEIEIYENGELVETVKGDVVTGVSAA